jgi:bifunctional non-homologous end joining protein LigD
LPTQKQRASNRKTSGDTTPKKLLIAHLSNMQRSHSNRAFQTVPPESGWNDWIHEIKHDGYRLVVERDGRRVRFFTRNGHLWTDRYSLIVEVALRNRSSLFAIDGEAVQLGGDGVSDCNGLHSLRHDDEVPLYASDVMELDGDDLRKLPLTMRKTNPARLLARRRDGIFIAPLETGEIGPDLFWKACKFGFEGLVSKRRDSHYRPGRSPSWIKVKNRAAHPAMEMVKEAFS